MSIDNDSNLKPSDTTFAKNDDSLSMQDSLQKNLKAQPKPFTKTKAFYGLIGGAVLLIVVVVIILMSLGGNKEVPNTQAIAQPTEKEVELAEIEAAKVAQREAVVDPAIASLPPTDYIFSPNPVEALANQTANDLFGNMPEYNALGADISTVDGRFISANDPYILQSLEETKNMISGYILENRLIDSRFQGDTEGWYIRNGEGFEDVDYVPLDNPAASSNLRENMKLFAITQLRPKLEVAPWQTRQVAEPLAVIPQVVVNPALTEEERDRLLTMIDTQRNNNLELVRENQDLRKEQQEVKMKVVDLVQRLEDNPAVSARLRATMIPESSGWKVSAIVGDRIYLINKDNITVTLSQGDRLPNSDLIISHSDESSGIVLVTPSTK